MEPPNLPCALLSIAGLSGQRPQAFIPDSPLHKDAEHKSVQFPIKSLVLHWPLQLVLTSKRKLREGIICFREVRNIILSQAVVAHAFNPNSWEAEAGR